VYVLADLRSMDMEDIMVLQRKYVCEGIHGAI
jgi:hypothetical protein